MGVGQRLPSGVKHSLRQVVAHAASLTPEPATRRVLIFAQGRTGSTLLEQLLGSTGHFRTGGELLGHGRAGVWSPVAHVDGMARYHRRDNYVCHVKVYHLGPDREQAGRAPVDPGDFLHELHDRGWDVVYLRREDRVRHALSNMVAEARGSYHKRDGGAESTTIVVDRADLVRRIEARAGREEQERLALQRVPHLELVYERDLRAATSQQPTVDRVLRHAGLEPREATTELRRINSRSLRSVVRNYDDFAEWVRELGWGSSLDRGPEDPTPV